MSGASLVETILDIWIKGGWLMVPLALLAFVIYATGFELIYFFRRYGFDKLDKNTWGHWIDRPDEAEGEVGKVIRFCHLDHVPFDAVRSLIKELRLNYLEPAYRRIQYLSIMVTIAPLAGLLGTVVGMIVTFEGLSSSRGSALDVVAGGISQALITTQTGLIIAIPGYILVHFAKRRCARMDGFFAELESISAQKLERAKTSAS
jgi:biopolymer transport protein ExbB